MSFFFHECIREQDRDSTRDSIAHNVINKRFHFLFSPPFSFGFDCHRTSSKHTPVVECHYQVAGLSRCDSFNHVATLPVRWGTPFLGLSPLANHTGMGRRDKARFSAGRGRQSVVSQVQCSSGNGSLRLMEKCCIVRPSCFVAFQPPGSLLSSLPKQLSPLELDDKAMDLNLECLDDFSVFGNFEFYWEGSDQELDVGSNPVGSNLVASSFCKYLSFSWIIVWALCCNCICY